MLDWYRRLLQLRREFITHSARTCRAHLSGAAVVMQVPAENPVLELAVTIDPRNEATGRQPQDEGERQSPLILHSCSDGYEVWIFAVGRRQSATDLLERIAS